MLIDMGNSRVKWRLWQDSLTLNSGAVSYAGGTCGQWFAGVRERPARVLVSSVAGVEAEQQLQRQLHELGFPAPEFAVTQASACGVSCGYQDYRALGVDRWLALLAAHAKTGQGCVLADSGTALTVDLLAPDGVHLGGFIGPGVGLMRRSLAGESRALAAALSEPYSQIEGPGRDTRSAIDGAVGAMGAGLIERGLALLPQVPLVLTGGDSRVWASMYEKALVYPELVFDGLVRYFAASR
nr:type III pantothenate kinase [Gilvimarinus xylanilyticus]